MDISGFHDPESRAKIFQLAVEGKLAEQQYAKKLAGEKELIEHEYKQKKGLIGDKLSMLSFGGEGQESPGMGPTPQKPTSFGTKLPPGQIPPKQEQDPVVQQFRDAGMDPSQFSDEDILRLTAIDAPLGRAAQHAKDISLRENREREKLERERFESERTYHTGFSKEAEKEVEGLRNSLPKKEMSLNFARDAIQNGDVSYFSLDKLADVTNQDLFRTAKGAQLITASKENLLSNMSRVSAKGQNQWFEQRLNTMFPKIGQNQEANLTVQEMLEGEVAMDKAYLNEFDRISEEDQKNYGFVKKDINKRAHNAAKAKQKEIFQRTTFRMKEIEEVEKGLSELKKEVGKNVPRGTPLTLAMAKLYRDKFGKEAQAVAKKNGYYIPSVEEYKVFRSTPQEFREENLE